MNILLTGMTTLQVKPPEARRTAVKKIDVPLLIRDTLVKLGHRVEWRRTHVGEDLSQFDMLLICWSGVLSLNAKPGALGALWAASQPIPQIIFWDDWQFRSQLSHMRTLGRKPNYLSKPGLSGAEFYYDSDPQEAIQANADAILETCHEMAAPWPADGRRLALCPMYAWGDHSLVLHDLPSPRERITYLDPSPFILDDVLRVIHTDPLGDKFEPRTWTLPSLMPHGEWVERQHLTWPVEYFGSRKMKAQRLKTEDDVIRAVSQHEGILSPKYHHSGSGWWRSRFLYGAALGVILGGDPSEGGCLGQAYQLHPREIEELDLDARETIVEAQRETLIPLLWTHEQWLESVRQLPSWLGL